MADTNKKTGLLSKFLNALSGKPTEEEPPKVNKDLFGPSKDEPVDLHFVKSFTASGGKFLYCEKEADAYDYLKEITKESGLKQLYCNDPGLKSILSKAGLRNLAPQVERADAFCSTCEFLVSFNGGIMITAKQTMGKKLNELPDTFITFARTSQIVQNLRAALTGIRTKYKGDIPSQITTIKGPIEGDNPDEADSKLCKKRSISYCSKIRFNHV
ncbi:MAG: LUD domain-containing protein [Owenweeksia sp.]|nr:LUD domain-containing protein [Owenweeksia sp.]